VLVPIFQQLIEEEAAEQRESFPSITSRVCIRLALVSKCWKEIVYTFPSLWSIFDFNMNDQTAVVQKKFDRLISLAKNAPVDLLIENIHERERCPRHRFWNCPSSYDTFFPSLRRIPNLRSLCLHFLHIFWQTPITPDALPSLANLTYFHIGGSNWDERTINPADFFGLMPRLEELKMECMIFQRHYDRGLNNGLLLLRLRSLDLSVDAELYASGLLELLRHCPSLEYLRIRGPIKPDDSDTLVNLPNLLLLRVTNEDNGPGPFATDLIKTPNLLDLVVDSNDWHAFGDWRAFFRQNPAIKTLTIPTHLQFVR
jgi:hypothetical protein